MGDKPKVLGTWVVHRADWEERSLFYSGDEWDHAAGMWKLMDGRIAWTACRHNASNAPCGDLGQGVCDTVEQAKAAAEQALRDAGYKFEGEGEHD